MESNLNKYIAVAYKLYTVDGEVSELVEEATDGEPFQFISGYGIALDAFEQKVAALEKGAEFDFTLTKDDAYGDYEQEHVLDLDKAIFSIHPCTAGFSGWHRSHLGRQIPGCGYC